MANPVKTSSAENVGPFASWRVDHAAMRVPDLDSAVDWYVEMLNFRLIRTVPLGDLNYAFLSPASDPDFAFEVVAGPGAESRPSYADHRTSLNLSGWHHIGFRVDSVDDAVDELKRRGVTIVMEPRDVVPMGLRLAFFADPWGNLFEVIQPIGE